MDKEYTIIAINDTQTLLQYRAAILDLFALCFDNEMDPDLWDWAYQNNPCGDAYVQLAYNGDEIVGHYAMIPQYYRNNTQQQMVALSMTTMVHPSHRRAGLFQTLAGACYEKATRDGLFAVLGFPNSKSTPGFKKRLQWQCNDDYQIIKIKTIKQDSDDQFQIITPDEFCDCYQANGRNYMLDLNQKELLLWRLSKPGTDYLLLQGEQQTLFIVKPYAETLDVVFASTPVIPEGLRSYAENHGYTALVSFSTETDSQTDYIEGTQYRFGYRGFQNSDIHFSPQLIMSDVF